MKIEMNASITQIDDKLYPPIMQMTCLKRITEGDLGEVENYIWDLSAGLQLEWANLSLT